MNTTAAYNGLSEWIWSLALYVLKKTVFANTNIFIEYLKYIQMTTIKKLYLFCWKVIKTNRTFIGFLGFVWLKWRLLFWNAQFGAILQDEIKKNYVESNTSGSSKYNSVTLSESQWDWMRKRRARSCEIAKDSDNSEAMLLILAKTSSIPNIFRLFNQGEYFLCL